MAAFFKDVEEIRHIFGDIFYDSDGFIASWKDVIEDDILCPIRV